MCRARLILQLIAVVSSWRSVGVHMAAVVAAESVSTRLPVQWTPVLQHVQEPFCRQQM
jgi:hypothetical protein